MPKTTRAKKQILSNSSHASYATTVKIGGLVYEQRYYEPMHNFDPRRAKTIRVIAFDGENRILAIRNKSRVDIINGSLTWEDDTPEHGARREAKEEGNVTLGEVTLAAVIENNPHDAPEQIDYTLVMAARIKSIDAYQEWHGKPRRAFFTKENLLKRFSADKAKALSKLIDMAEFVLADKPYADPIIQHIINNF